VIPAYRLKIKMNQERKQWPSQVEVADHPNTNAFTLRFNCDPDCPRLYECIVVRMLCPPGHRRLWKLWQDGGVTP
jgi:hypothetical protein